MPQPGPAGALFFFAISGKIKMYDYFDIFLDRMTMCSKAARVLDAKFSLVVSEQRVL